MTKKNKEKWERAIEAGYWVYLDRSANWYEVGRGRGTETIRLETRIKTREEAVAKAIEFFEKGSA